MKAEETLNFRRPFVTWRRPVLTLRKAKELVRLPAAVVLLALLSLASTRSVGLEPLQGHIGIVAANPIAVSLTPLLRGVEFEVVNHTNLTVTAWQVKVTGKVLDGTDLDGGTGCDAYGEFAGLYTTRDCMIRPHATIRNQHTLAPG